MALWDKVKEGIDKAGKAAQGALDEGKLRLDAYRAREQADKAAEALGYAVYRAIDGGRELETEARDRLVSALRSREEEAKRLESDLAAARASNPDAGAPGGGGPGAGASGASTDGSSGGSGSSGAGTPPSDAPPQSPPQSPPYAPPSA